MLPRRDRRLANEVVTLETPHGWDCQKPRKRGTFRSSLGEPRPIPICASSSSSCTKPKNDRCGNGTQQSWAKAQHARVEQAMHGVRVPATGSAPRRAGRFPCGLPTHPRKPLRASASLETTSTSTSSPACGSSARGAGYWFQSASLIGGLTSTPPGFLADCTGILTTHA